MLCDVYRDDLTKTTSQKMKSYETQSYETF